MNMTFTHVHFHFAQVSEGHILCIQGHGGHVVEESISALFNKSHQATGCIDVNFPASKVTHLQGTTCLRMYTVANAGQKVY